MLYERRQVLPAFACIVGDEDEEEGIEEEEQEKAWIWAERR